MPLLPELPLSFALQTATGFSREPALQSTGYKSVSVLTQFTYPCRPNLTFPTAFFQAGVSALQQGSGGALGSTAATVASTLQQAGGRFSGSAGKVAGAVTSAVTSDLVSNTVNGMLQGGANRLTQLLSGGGGPVSALGGGP